MIVPTAADLAFGIDFGADRLCDEDGCHRANSPKDFGHLFRCRNFHKAMVECFATAGSTPYMGCRLGAMISPKEAKRASISLFSNRKWLLSGSSRRRFHRLSRDR